MNGELLPQSQMEAKIDELQKLIIVTERELRALESELYGYKVQFHKNYSGSCTHSSKICQQTYDGKRKWCNYCGVEY